MNEHLDFLYSWFSKADSHPQFPNQQFSPPIILTVKQELTQLSNAYMQMHVQILLFRTVPLQ